MIELRLPGRKTVRYLLVMLLLAGCGGGAPGGWTNPDASRDLNKDSADCQRIAGTDEMMKTRCMSMRGWRNN
jgi:hypothetical protein